MGKRHIPKNLRSKAKKNSVGIAAAAFAVCFVLLVSLIGAVVAKYQRELRSDDWVKAQDFYFTSDLLDGATHRLAPGSTEVSFTLSNRADDLRFSEVDIDYKVTVTPDNGSGASVAVNNDMGTLKNGESSDVKITISDLEAGTYTVTAVGTGGYSKTLTAKIVVPEKKAQLYYHLEDVSGEYILLTVWNEGDEAGEITIHYTGLPDNTNPDMTTWKTGEDQTVSINAHESKVFRFFNETVSNVKVTGVNGETVQSKTPN